MSDFDKLCKTVEQLDPATYGEVIIGKSKNILSALTAITLDGGDAVDIYLHFILASIAADGKLDPSEYEVIRPLLADMFGRDISYDEAKKIFKDFGLDRPKEYKDVVDFMVAILGMVSPELKEDIVLVSMLICSVDGKISRKEKKWIKQLIE